MTQKSAGRNNKSNKAKPNIRIEQVETELKGIKVKAHIEVNYTKIPQLKELNKKKNLFENVQLLCNVNSLFKC